MVNAADNELLTRVGPGTPMGDMLREYWVPACRSAQARSRRRARAHAPVRREFRRLPRHRRARRLHAGSAARTAALRLAPRPQRGRRPALHLPRLEIQRRRQMRRRARPSRASSATLSPQVVPVRSHPTHEAGGHGLGLYGHAGDAAALPRLRIHRAWPPTTSSRSAGSSAPTGCRASRRCSTARMSASSIRPI